MKFIEFTQKQTGTKEYFVGTSHQAILADTKDGEEFGGIEFSSYQTLTKEEVEKLNLGYFAAGVEAVEGGCPSYKLKNPTKTLQEEDRIHFCACQAGGYILKIKGGELFFSEQDSRGDWDDDVVLKYRNQGRFSTAVSQLKWERGSELRKLEEMESKKTRIVSYLQKIDAFLERLNSLPE